MWRLISTWHRTDGSVVALDALRRRPSIGRRLRSRRDAVRSERLADTPTAERIIAALGPVTQRHGMGPPQSGGDSVIWCTSTDELRTTGQDPSAHGAPYTCTDLNVYVDRANRTVAVDFDGHGLAEFITGRSHWDGPIAVDLSDDLDVALGRVATHLDRLCESVIIADR